MSEYLSGAWNFRDVAETAALTPGRLFRSSELSRLDDAGRLTLSALAISDVTDLRSPVEVSRRGPGALPDGVVVHNLPFPEVTNSHDAAAPHEASWQKMMLEGGDDEPAAAARKWMTAEYEQFPTLAGARRAVAELISLLADGRSVLVHCFAGKDRTGFAVATALEAAGVDRDAVMADYLRSNAAVDALRERIVESLRRRDGMTDEVLSFAESRLTEEVLGVREEYLSSARRVLDETYGGLPQFLAAAGVADETVARLRMRLMG